MRTTRVFALVAALVASLFVTAPALAAAPASAGRFIVTLNDGVNSRTTAAEYQRRGADVDYVYTAALNGFAGSLSDENVRALRSDRRVARIERDGTVTASATTQSGATWGLDRVDQRSGTNSTYTYEHTGSGVTAYIVDTGIRYSHADLVGRATKGYDAFGGTGSDCNGHGTHVAGTVGGKTWGVAKSVSLVAVRVLDCNGSGSWSGVIAGLDWITANNGSKPAVANMSLGGGASSSVDDAVEQTIAAGVTVAVAAGNGNRAGVAQDACNYSPARVPAALTIGATTSSDAKTSWSNYGACVDLFAPGLSIKSAWYTSDTATNTISGTSMATPHVAGVAALYLQQAPGATPATVANAITTAATDGVVTSSSTANNDLLYSLVSTGSTIATGTLSGTVTSSTGTAIAGATVAVAGRSDTTGADGSYTIPDVPQGSYTATASADGYVSGDESVTITGGETTSKDFVLAADSPDDTATIDLTLTKGTKKRNVTPVTASWTDSGGSAGRSYDVWANGKILDTVTATEHTQNWRGSGTVTYRICRAGGTATCSPDESVTV